MLLEQIKPVKVKAPKTRNFVAKHSKHKSGAGAHVDKKKDYKRKPKHAKKLFSE